MGVESFMEIDQLTYLIETSRDQEELYEKGGCAVLSYLRSHKAFEI